jgi:proline iminopeptidase
MRPTEGHLTTEEGVRLYFQTVGAGPQMVAIPNGLTLLDDFRPLAEGRTLLAYDVRHRGRSDTIADPAKLQRGIHDDVDDLEAVRRHFGLERMSLIGHSYVGVTVALYAMTHPTHAERIVQIAPMGPAPAKTYPPPLSYADDVGRDVFARLAGLQAQRDAHDPVEFCRRFWSVLRALYVTDPADAEKLRAWDRCDLPNERNFMKYWTGSILPSLKALDVRADDASKVTAPVLILHGTKDRSAPSGGAKEWAALLPNARLLTIEGGGHAPWIEAPARVFGALEDFLATDREPKAASPAPPAGVSSGT